MPRTGVPSGVSWENQGRQEHGWFGHGVAPEKPKGADPGALSTNASRDDLAAALAYGAIASVPAGQRARAEASFQGRNLTAFREAILAWMRGTGMEPEMFADHFFGRSADDPVVQALRDAAKLAMTSTTQADMAVASGKVADAMQRIGLDRWSRFLADAQTRAHDPATEAAIRASLNPRDAIQPAHPELAVGLGAAGLRGAAALARAAGRATLRQLRPDSQPAAPPNADKPTNATDSNASANPNAGNQTRTSARKLPANPDDLPAQGWRETTHPRAGEQGHRTFENPTTGESLRFDRGRPGERGFEGQDHYHRLNPNSTGNRDLYLDGDGNPVPRGSNRSHIFPGRPSE